MYSKELLKGTIEAMVLKLLAENERMYGYEIAQKVKEITDGKILLKDGSLYPALHKLLKKGMLNYEEQLIGNRVRKYYFLTIKGKNEQVAQLNELKDFVKTLSKVFTQDLQPKMT